MSRTVQLLSRALIHKAPAKCRSEAGFTLVETMVALVLLAILSVMALTAISTLQSVNRVEQQLESRSEVMALRNHLVRMLSDVRPVYRDSVEGQSLVAFAGFPDKLSFATVLDDQVVRGGLYDVQYSLDSGTLQFEYRMKRFAGSTQAWEILPLIEGVSAFKLRYFGPSKEARVSHWTEKWIQPDRLPLAIEVNIQFDDNDLRTWEPLVVDVQAAH